MERVATTADFVRGGEKLELYQDTTSCNHKLK